MCSAISNLWQNNLFIFLYMLTILNNTIFNYIIFNVNNYCKFLIFRNKVYYNIVFLSRWGKNAMNKYTLSLIYITSFYQV